MGAPRQGLNPTTNSVGFTAKLVTVRSVSEDGSTAIVVDRQNTQTQVPMLVQRSKGPLPAAGDAWLIAQDLGMWTFAAFVGSSGSDFAESGPAGSQVTIAPNAPASPTADDIWVNSGNDNQVNAWNGSTWVAAQFGAAAIAPGSITSGEIAPDAGISSSQVSFTASDIGGVSVTISAQQPASPSAGDLWYDSANGYALNEWNGSAWVTYQYGTEAIAAGAVTADLIAANTITAAQLAAGLVVAGIVDGTTVEGATFLGTNWIENEAGSFYYSGPPGPGNLIGSDAALPGADAFGNAYVAGKTGYDQGAQVAVSILDGAVVYYTSTGYEGPWTPGARIHLAGTSLQIIAPGGELDIGGGLIAASVAILAEGGVVAAQPGSGGGVIETWHDVPAASGFTVNTVQRYKLSPDNTVHVQFSLASTNTAGTHTLFTLPGGYVPAFQYDGGAPRIFNTDTSYVDSLLNTGFRVTTGGAVQIVDLPGTAVNNVSGYYVVPLD